MNGEEHINACLYDVGKIQTVSTDTNLRTIALNWLNRVIRHIASRDKQWTWLEKAVSFNTVEDVMSYSPMTDLDLSGRKILSIRQKETPKKLIYIDQQYFDELEPKPDSRTGNPEFYTLWGQTIKLWPVPADVYTMYVRYIKTITAFTDATASTSDIPEKFDDVIQDGMKIHAFRMFPKWGNSANQVLVFESGIRNMKIDNTEILDDDGYQYAHTIGKRELREAFPFDESSVGD